MKLVPGRLPQAPIQYDPQQMDHIIRQLEQALTKDVELRNDAEEKEAINYFLSN